MELLYFLEGIRIPVLNELMLAITYLGDEMAFLAVALVFFWCVDKRRGYYIMAVGFFGTVANQFLKLACRIPRPWVLDKDFTILEPAREAATGYSFPSGHSQNAVGVFGGIARTTKRPWVRYLCLAVAVLVPISRMYVGVHTPYDVSVAAIMAVCLIFLLEKVVFSHNGRWIPRMFAVAAALALGLLVYVEAWPFPEDVDPENLASGVKNAYTLLGALLGIIVVYFVDERVLHFPTEACWWAQILKVLGGLVLVLAVLEGSKSGLNGLFGGHMIARAVRYFLTVVVAGCLWPMSFPFFARLGKERTT